MLRFLKVALLMIALALSACTSITDLKEDMSERLFGRESNETPSDLNDIKTTVPVKVLWNAHLGESYDNDFTAVTENGFVYAASANGEIVKLTVADGKQVWRINTGERLSGGVGLGENLLFLGTAKGYVIAYDFAGKLIWKSKVSSQVLSAPKVDYKVLVVRCEDSRIYGLNVADGSRKWVYTAGIQLEYTQWVHNAGPPSGSTKWVFLVYIESDCTKWAYGVGLKSGSRERVYKVVYNVGLHNRACKRVHIVGLRSGSTKWVNTKVYIVTELVYIVDP